ncbi:polysaccharide lyase family 14 protein [Atractiella rhizophila]|nr:polysaccharide lyase family 14 protein [Atractiella rhizophila]
MTLWTNTKRLGLGFSIFYPKGTWNPSDGNGGTGFYAHPLALGAAKNITFEYSVYFPSDFDFVKGGKLPGLYGGRQSCSGGDPATDCFSTRMMWRTAGAGEMYLYVPRDKQAANICAMAWSGCDTTDGISISRGSFTFKKGAWNKIRQDIVLNTPGKQDGGFTIWFNDKAVSHADSGVYYRSVSSVATIGIQWESFFGGSDSSWATPKDTFTYYTRARVTINS